MARRPRWGRHLKGSVAVRAETACRLPPQTKGVAIPPAGCQTDVGTLRIMGTAVDVEDVLHAPDKGRAPAGRDAPLLLQVRLEIAF